MIELNIPIMFLLALFVGACGTDGDDEKGSSRNPYENSTDDLSGMRERHRVRVLISHNKTNVFIVKRQRRGFEYELLQQYEKYLNKKLTRRQIRTDLVYIPVPFNHLFPGLLQGEGDIAAAGLTITPERLEQAVFTDPLLSGVDEIVVASRKVKGLDTVEDLSGRKVFVLRGNSYVQHLRKLNARFRSEWKRPIKIMDTSENLQTEDILEMVNAGIVDLSVADRHIAEIWSTILTEMVLRHDVKVNAGGRIAWAVRDANPELLRSLNAFIEKNKMGTFIGNVLFRRYYKDTRWIKNPLTERERKKLDIFTLLFRKYSDRFGFDWRAIAAQAYQESGLDHGKRSSRGAIGIKQVLPTTAADPAVNIPNIRNLENNIHAGVKYMSILREKYFSAPEINPEDRTFFSLAAYNAGPTKVKKLRKRAKRMGLDPNRWFLNVERAALQVIGQETVQYVANIHKYYVAYKLMEESL